MGHKISPKIKALFTALLLTLQFNSFLFSASPAYAVTMPEIGVSKDDYLDSVVPGQTITYKIDVSSGDEDATDVVVTETLPDYTTFNSWYLDSAIANGGFELGDFTGWVENDPDNGLVVTDSQKHSGSYSLGILGDGYGSEDGYIEQELCPQVPVDSVTEFSIWGKTPYSGVGLEITVTYIDGPPTVVDYYGWPGDWPNTAWSKKDLTSSLTPGKTIERIKIRGSQHFATWDFAWHGYFDDIVLKVDLDGPPFVYERCLLEEGDPLSFTFIVDVDDPVPSGAELITNTVEVSAHGVSPVTATDEDLLNAAPDIIVLKEDDSSDSIVPGQTVTYDITVANVGNQDATGVEVMETVPEFTTFNASLSPGWICSNGDCSYNLGPLEVDEVVPPLEFAVDVGDSPVPAGMEAIENTVTASDDGANGADLVPENNLYLDSDFLDAAPDLQITKSDGGLTEVLAGGTVAYNLVCINTGTQDAEGVIIEETVPKYTTFSASGSFCSLGWSCADGAPAGTKCYCEVGSLPVGASSNLSFAVIVKAAIAGVYQITNTATVYDDGGSGLDLNSSDNEATDATPVNPGEIAALATAAEEEEAVEEAPEEVAAEVKGVEEVLFEEEEPVVEEEEEAVCQDPSWWISILLLQGILSLLVSRFGKEWRRNAYVIQIVLALLAVLILRRFFCAWWLPWAAVVLGLASLYLTSQRIQSSGGGSSGKSKKLRR